MGHELRVTTDGLAQIEVAGVIYPLCFSVLAFKHYAEYLGVSYHDAVSSEWSTTDISAEDLRKLLELALESGENRRRVFEQGTGREIDEDLVDKIFELYHPEELGLVLVQAWSGPDWVRALERMLAGVRGEEVEDPQMTPAGTSPGPSSSERPTG